MSHTIFRASMYFVTRAVCGYSIFATPMYGPEATGVFPITWRAPIAGK